MTPERTPEGKCTIYRIVDGQPLVRWPIDARHMLAIGGYTTDPPEPTAAADSVAVVPDDDAAPVASAPSAAPQNAPLLHSPGVPLVTVGPNLTQGAQALHPTPRPRRSRA